jgi:hypothetical protein
MHDVAYIELVSKLRARGNLSSGLAVRPLLPDELLIEAFLPNEFETHCTIELIKKRHIKPVSPANKPLLPLRGRISSRGGYALKRSDIPRMLNDFLYDNPVNTIFVIQGGNRHITRYIRDQHQAKPFDMKLMCASKASLAVILSTIIGTEDLLMQLSKDQTDRVLATLRTLAESNTQILQRRSEELFGTTITQAVLRKKALHSLLQLFCEATIYTPFVYPTDDSMLSNEFKAMHDMIEQDAIAIPYLNIVRILLERTHLRQLFVADDRLVFIDDLFYRGRTLFTIACILKVFDIDPRKAHLYTLCADRISHNLRSDYITVLDNNALYPFENSIRTERGYWQRAHGRFTFADLEEFWQYLALTVDASSSMRIYETWQTLLERLWLLLPPNKLTKKMNYALIWYFAFHKMHKLPIDLASLVDQRGEGIGYCVPYARIIDNFISQEEPVEKRLTFKDNIHEAVNGIWSIDAQNPRAFDAIVTYYRRHTNVIDYEGLQFIFDIYDYGT